MRVNIRMVAMASNTKNYIIERCREEEKFFYSDPRYNLWENLIACLPDNQNPDQCIDLALQPQQQPEGRPERGSSAGQFILWLRLELQRRWLAWLVDFTVRRIEQKLRAAQAEDQGRDVLYVVVLPEFFFTDRCRDLSYSQAMALDSGSDSRVYYRKFKNPFERKIISEFINGWLPTMQKLRTLESLAKENVIVFAGTILWKLPAEYEEEEEKKEIFNNTLTVFAEGRCTFAWDKQIIPSGEVPEEYITHPPCDASAFDPTLSKAARFSKFIPWLSPETRSVAGIPLPVVLYKWKALPNRHLIFSMDICADFCNGVADLMLPKQGPDFHVVVAAGAAYRLKNVPSKELLFYCDNQENLNSAFASVVDAAARIEYSKVSFARETDLCWCSPVIEREIER